MVTVTNVRFSARTQLCCAVTVLVLAAAAEVAALSGPNVCMVKQKYNITMRVKYRAPLSVRTYEWCMALPPRCSRWRTEVRDLTRLETEERTAEVAVCCPGYKMRDVSCVPICPSGRTGPGCSQECPPLKWGPNCVNECGPCEHGTCSPVSGDCSCQHGWQGESCESRMSSSTSTTTTAGVEELLTKITATKPTQSLSAISSTTALIETTSISATTIPTTAFTTTATSPTTVKQTTSLTTTKLPQEFNTTLRISSEETIYSSKKQETIDSQKISTTNSTRITTAKPTTITTPVMTTLATTVMSNTEVKTGVTPSTETIKIVETTTKPNITFDKGEPISKINVTPKTTIHKENAQDKFTTVRVITTESSSSTVTFGNISLTRDSFNSKTHTAPNFNVIYNKTEPNQTTKVQPKEVHVEIKTTPVRILKTNNISKSTVPTVQKTTAISVFTETPILTTHATTITEGGTKVETTRRPDATIRYFPTTVKFKPKEIWIRPAQKGESFDSKKVSESNLKHRVATNKEPQNTTPKTIIVSIIPTSVSYATFKKIALTTAGVVPPAANVTYKSNTTGYTKPMSVLTTLLPPPLTISTSQTFSNAHSTKETITKAVNSTKSNENIRQVTKISSTTSITEKSLRYQSASLNGTNSMRTVTKNLKSSNSLTPTVSSTNFITTTHKTSVANDRLKGATRHAEKVTKPVTVATKKPILNEKYNASAKITVIDKEKTNATKLNDTSNSKTNTVTTESPDDEETFHILTEPEHITAVMEGKEKQRTSVDLISVISIAGGIMMAVITVAVIIVMIERCKRPRYEDVRKMNDIHMQVMIDNHEVPPPYVRSIFHTPLPDPPSSDKCHYQPISTLDRNLKQFMRPVVVQTISPIMLENFRGILECHYDHLPRRSHDFEVKPRHCSVSPSSEDADELSRLRPCSIAELTIDASQCEAKLDVLDSTTSEPLYAEIPCWRPPSEHAIEVMNYNGEAVTEL